MRLFLALFLTGAAFGQAIYQGPAHRVVTGSGIPSAGLCASSGDVGKVYVRSDAGSTNSSFYVCDNTGVATFAWELTSGGGLSPAGVNGDVQMKNVGGTLSPAPINCVDGTNCAFNGTISVGTSGASRINVVQGTCPGTATGGYDYTLCFESGILYKVDSLGAKTEVNGGGGGSILSGTFAALPSCTTTNYLYRFTTGLIDSAVCDGASTLTYFSDGFAFTPASALSLSSGHLDTGVVASSTKGYETLTFPASGAAVFSSRYFSAPSTPYTVYLHLRVPLAINTSYRNWAVGFMDNTGKARVLECGINITAITSAFACRITSYNADGTYNTSSDLLGTNVGYAGYQYSPNLYIALSDDGTTNMSFGVSSDGISYLPLQTESRTTFIAAPTRITYGGTNSANNGPLVVTLIGKH